MKLAALLLCAAVALAQTVCESYTLCTDCIADPRCGYCAVIMLPDANGVTPPSCMQISDGPLKCPRYPARFSTGKSSLLSLTAGFPVNPSAASVYLLPDNPYDLAVTVTIPVQSNDGLDIFLTLDLSGSFRDDLPNFANVLPGLIVDVLKINTDAYFGISSYIEVPLEPFGWQNGWTDTTNIEFVQNAVYTFPSSMLDTPWPASSICPLNNGLYADAGGRGPGVGFVNYKFCMEQPLTPSYTTMQKRFAALITHSNIDFPEPSLDAMFYSANCMSEWRPNARKLLVVVTDARPHLPTVEACTVQVNQSAIGCVDTTVDYVSLGLFQNQNNLDCNLDPATTGWISSYWANTSRPANAWSYTPNTIATLQYGGGGPGTGENYINAADVEDALRGTSNPSRGVVIPLIACANGDPNNIALAPYDIYQSPYWDRIIGNFGFGFSRVLTLGANTNLAQLILDALAALQKTVQMVVQSDPNLYVNAISPVNAAGQHLFANTSPGQVVKFTVTLQSTGTTVSSSIVLEVLGFGNVDITISPNTTCPGCNGNPNWREDLCGFCEPTVPNRCVDCRGIPGGGSVVDACGICGGDGTTCVGCNPLDPYNLAYQVDACGVCLLPTDPLFNTTCAGCDGRPNSGLQNDACGVCNGNNTCLGCDGVAYSNLTFDNCSVCGGNGSSCVVIPPPLSPAVAASIAVGLAVFFALVVIAILAVIARLAKNKIDERKFMNAFAAGNAIGTNPLHVHKGGWKNNAVSN